MFELVDGYDGGPYQMESFICIVRQLSTRVLALERVEVSAIFCINSTSCTCRRIIKAVILIGV